MKTVYTEYLIKINLILKINQYNKQFALVRLIMTGNILAGKNNGGYKYGGIAEKPPNLTRHYFTCNIIFTQKFVNPPNFTCHIAKCYPIYFRCGIISLLSWIGSKYEYVS